MFEDFISKREAREAFDNMIGSGLVELYAYYHQKHSFGSKLKVIKLPMNTSRDHNLAASIFDENTQVYVNNMITGWLFHPKDLDELSPTIAIERRS